MGLDKIWVFGEANGDAVASITLEMLAAARELADTVEVFMAGARDDYAAELGEHGAFAHGGAAGRVVGAANHVYASIADRAATVLIHQALPASGDLGDFALAADGDIPAILPKIADVFVKAEVRHFDYAALDQARAWLLG